MNPIKKYLLKRWKCDLVADELHRTTQALERSRNENKLLTQQLKEAENKLLSTQVEALELERSNQHLLGELRKQTAQRKPSNKQRHQQLRQAVRPTSKN